MRSRRQSELDAQLRAELVEGEADGAAYAVGGVAGESAAISEKPAEPAGVLAVNAEQMGDLLDGDVGLPDAIDVFIQLELAVEEAVDDDIDGAVLAVVVGGVVAVLERVLVARRGADGPAGAAVGGAAWRISPADGPGPAWGAVGAGSGAAPGGHDYGTPMKRRIQKMT